MFSRSFSFEVNLESNVFHGICHEIFEQRMFAQVFGISMPVSQWHNSFNGTLHCQFTEEKHLEFHAAFYVRDAEAVAAVFVGWKSVVQAVGKPGIPCNNSCSLFFA